MLDFFRHGDRVAAAINLSGEDVFRDGSPLDAALAHKLEALRAIPSQRPPTLIELGTADLLYDEGVLLSPRTVFRKGRPLNRGICTHLCNLSPFGVTLRERLEDEGCFDFLKTVSSYSGSLAVLERATTVLAISTDGLDTADTVPHELLHAFVDYFRTDDGLRWRDEIFGVGDISKQSMSQFVSALARIYPEANINRKNRQYRSKTAGRYTWAYHINSSESQVQGVIRFHELYNDEALTDPSKIQKVIQILLDYLAKHESNRSIEDVLQCQTRSVTFGDYMTASVGGVTRHVMESTRIAKSFTDFVVGVLLDEFPDKEFFPLISEREILKLKNGWVSTDRKRSTAAARPLPEKIIPLLRDILDEGELGWPGSSRHFDVEISHAGERVKLYCPVIPTVLSAALDIPLRIVQIRRLDSGEGDIRRFNADTMSWEDNDGPHAGYWAAFEGNDPGTVEPRGYARLIQDPLKDVTGFFINTNKTGVPYEIPWQLDRLHKAFWNVRKWQEKYNPVAKPVEPDDYLDNNKRIAKSTKARMPRIFGLFRLFPTGTRHAVGRVVLHDEVEAGYVHLLREAERRWSELYPDIPMELVRRDRSGFYRPLYGLHGLRVRGITNLHRSGMPLEVISKFVVGHATLMMTSYYLKLTPTEIQGMLERAAENSEKARNLIDSFKTIDVEEARRRAVSLDPAAISAAVMSQAKLEFCNVDFGFCPWDATRCDDGGPVLREDSQSPNKVVFGPVPGGRNNCIMCRHFVSGPPFLVQLHGLGTKLCERREHLAREEARINLAVYDLEATYRTKSLSTAQFQNKLDVLQQQMIAVKDDQEITENSIFNTEVLCNSAVRLMEASSNSCDGVSLIANSRDSVIEYLEVTPFERNTWLVAASRVYPVLGEPRIEQNRDRFLELVLFNSALTPPRMMNSITEKQATQAMDLYAELILSHLSRAQIKSLESGALSLHDVGLEAQMRELLTQVCDAPGLEIVVPPLRLSAPEGRQ